MLPSGSNPLACDLCKDPLLVEKHLQGPQFTHTFENLKPQLTISDLHVSERYVVMYHAFHTSAWSSGTTAGQQSAICSTSSTATAYEQTEQMLWTKEVTFALSCFLNHVLLV